MNDNPYNPPPAEDTAVYEAELAADDSRFPHRPLGIAFFAAIYLLGGVSLFGVLALNLPTLSEKAGPFRSSAPILLGTALSMLLCLALSASAMALWRGARWGWWLGAFYCMSGIVQNAFVMLFIFLLNAQGQLPESATGDVISNCGLRMVIAALVFAYFFKTNVLEYFRLTSINKAKAIAILASVAMGLVALLNCAGNSTIG